MSEEDLIFTLARVGDVDQLSRLSISELNLENKNAQGHSALMLAAYHGHDEALSHFLSLGADPNTIDHGGGTPLIGVAFKGYLSCARLLVKGGANVRQKNFQGRTALDFAQMFGRLEIAMFLREVERETFLPNSSRFRGEFLDGHSIKLFKKEF